MIARYVALGLLACTMALSASAQVSLKSLVAENAVDWMFGSWKGQGSNGDSATLDVSWDLNKHVVVLHVKTDEMEAKGYTVIEPNEEQPKYYSFDSKGSVTKGSWNMEDNEIVLRVTTESPDRGQWKGAFVFGGTPEKGLQVRIHAIDSDGKLEKSAKGTFKFKKQ